MTDDQFNVLMHDVRKIVYSLAVINGGKRHAELRLHDCHPSERITTAITTLVGCSGYPLSPSPPTKKSTTSEDQTRKSGACDGAGDSNGEHPGGGNYGSSRRVRLPWIDECIRSKLASSGARCLSNANGAASVIHQRRDWQVEVDLIV
ncbi:MAG: hypothetical protein WAV78_16690 [Xanthobacteraceae bacterium]